MGGFTEPKEVKESTTDPESGMFHKSEKESNFAYTAIVACDRNNFVLGVKVAPGNTHDQIFTDIFQEVNQQFPEIEAVVVDAGYKTPGSAGKSSKPKNCPLFI